MNGKDLTDLLIEQGYIEPVKIPYILDGDSTFKYTTDEESQKEEKDRA